MLNTIACLRTGCCVSITCHTLMTSAVPGHSFRSFRAAALATGGSEIRDTEQPYFLKKLFFGTSRATSSCKVTAAVHRMLERLSVSLPGGLQNTNVGNIVADSLPLTSMLCCIPTLSIYWRYKRSLDLVSRESRSLPLWRARTTR